MMMGHYGAAFAAKRIAPALPLWVLFACVQAVDIGWALLVLAGVERVRVDPSLASNPLVLEYMPYTHSLLAALLWSGAAWALASRWTADARVAVAAAFAVGSHWLADLLVHRPDLPLWDDTHKLGLALWDHPLVATGLELGLLAGGAALCLGARGPLGAVRARVLALVAAMAALQLMLVFGGAGPTEPRAIVLGALALFVVLPLVVRAVAAPAEAGAVQAR